MIKYSITFTTYFIFIFQFVFAQESQVEVDLDQNKIIVKYQGEERLIGGEIKFEGIDYQVSKASSKGQKEGEIIQLSSLGKKKSEIKVNYSGNVVSFSIDPNRNNSGEGDDYVGMFFDIPEFQIGTSLFRYGESRAWTKPVQIKQIQDLDSLHNQFFYWRYQDSLYAVAIPLGGNGYSASIGREGPKFGAKSFSRVDNYYANDIPLLAIAFGKDIYPLIDELMEEGMEIMGYSENLRKNKVYPEVLENFGWCTWDAFGHKINEEKIIEGVASFTKNDFPVPFVLIDDGWLKVGEDMKLKSLKPDTTKFPGGFKPLVENLKNNYNVKNVGIWHTINAYWKGIDSSSDLGIQYKDILYSYQGKLPWSKDTLKTFYCPTPKNERGMEFFDDWYNYLSGEGISFIKVDNQLAVGQISEGQYPLWFTGQQLQKNFQIPASKYFNGNVINCMEMTTDNIYHFGKSAIARASDDYMPKEVSYNLESGNAAVHITNCLFNSLWLSPIVWPDYDMFESYMLYPEYHAIARAISGGPIYVSDWPGEQNFEVLKPLILNTGKILRTDIPARLTEDCLFQVQEAKPLKAYSFSGKAGLLGVWNAANSGYVTGSFKPSDLKGIQGEQFAVYGYFSQNAFQVSRNEELPLSLTRMDYKLYSIVPLEENAAVIGLINKYNSPKGIIKQKITKDEITATLAEAGTLGVYLIQSPEKVEVNNEVLAKDNYNFQNGLLKINVPEKFKGEVTVTISR
ncbi:MAG TPA: Sip1-related alpha-galactosidase [Cytophagales bacterium]|nr:Sip1-related alpha-galactosidase [Cytophagales bacterium]